MSLLKRVGALASLLVMCAIGFGFSTSSVAEESEADQRTIEEIVVISTKRARAEAVQDIPVATTVVNADMIAMNNLVNLIDVSRMVPNAQFKETATFPGVQRFWMRGVGVTFSVPNFDPAVGVYQDGVFVAQNVAAILDTFDQESIEILRGPQGSLFGRNTSVGAVNTRSKRPGDEFELDVELTFGEFDRNDYSVSIMGPITEQLGGKLAVMSRNVDKGWLENTAEGFDDVGTHEITHLKGGLVFTPNDTTDITLLAEYYDRTGDGAQSVALGTCDKGRDCHGLGMPARKWDELHDDEFPWGTHSDHEIYKVILEANVDVGHGVITSLTGYIDVNVHSGSQFEGIPPFIITTRLNIIQDQFSQELRYASTFSDTFDITAGLYYFTQNLTYGEQRAQGSRIGSPQPGITDPTNPYGIRAPMHAKLDHDAWAFFTEARFHLADNLTLLAGGRFTEEKKDVGLCPVYSGSCKANETPPFIGSAGWTNLSGPLDGWDIVDDETWTAFSPKVAVEFRPKDDMLLYTSWTRGFRSGGFTFRVGAAEIAARDASIAAGDNPVFRPAFYDRERVDSLEVGMKSDWADGRLRVNLTGFYQWWNGIQRNIQEGPVGNIIQRTANVEDSHVSGLELELNAILGLDMLVDGDSLRFDFAGGIVETGYDTEWILSGVDLTDQDFAAPHSTFYFGLSYDHPVGPNGAEMRWRTSYFWQEDYAPEGVPRDIIPPASRQLGHYDTIKLWDASVQYTSADGQWYVRAFGKNLGDYKYYVSRVPFSATFGVGLPAQPRTWGITLGYSLN